MLNTWFGFCCESGLPRKYHRGDDIRIGAYMYTVILRIGKWHLLKEWKNQKF